MKGGKATRYPERTTLLFDSETFSIETSLTLLLNLKGLDYLFTMAFSSKIRFTGCTIMTLGILLAGPVPVLLGFTATHIFSVDWPAGARLYPIWLFATNSAISVVALAFLWAYPVNRVFGITLAGLLGLCVYGGFWLSAVVVSFTSGILPDKNIWKVIGDNANILAFSMGLVLLLFGWFLSVRNERKAQ